MTRAGGIAGVMAGLAVVCVAGTAWGQADAGTGAANGAAATALREARACIARGDNACAIQALRGHRATAREEFLQRMMEREASGDDRVARYMELQVQIARARAAGRAAEVRRLEALLRTLEARGMVVRPARE